MADNIQEVKRKKRRLGFIYGLTSGFAFAFFTWGIDGFLLARANSAYYWVKFVPGILICLLFGGFTGWLTIRIEKHVTAVVLWGFLGILFSWLAVWLPFTGSQMVIDKLNPDLTQFFNFNQLKDLYQLRLISLVVIGLAAILCGLLEINLVQQAMLSNNGLPAFSAIVVCIFLFACAGSATDQMINSNLREPVQEINTLLQFAMENQEKDVPRITARKMHLSAVNQLHDVLQKKRHLILTGFDENLGMMDIMVVFDGRLVKCTTIYSQPTDCILIPQNP